MDEIFEITEFVQEEAGYGTDLIWGNCYDETLGDKISVTVIATGFEHAQSEVQKKPASDRIVVSLDDDEKKRMTPDKKSGLSDIGFEQGDKNDAATFEFDNVRQAFDKYQRNRYSYEDPYIKSEDKEREEEERIKRQERENQRRERLRSQNQWQGAKLNNPQTVNELENEPAYLRRNVHLEDVPDSGENAMSRWTITDDDEPELREGNSFLHDNVD